MQKAHFEIFINAPVEKVWDTMLEDETYRKWTAPFDPGSHYEGSWEQGEKLRFIGSDPEGKGASGMLSRVKENRKYEFISLEHYGIINQGVEDTESEMAKKWAPAYENYTFTSKDGGTLLEIDMDIEEEHKAEFDAMWPKALDELKKLAEE